MARRPTRAFNFAKLIRKLSVDEETDAIVFNAGTTLQVGDANIGTDSDTLEAVLTNSVDFDDIDSDYVQARQTPQDFAYSSLTGKPTIPSIGNDFVDSAFVTSEISNLVDAAPGTLNTLNELAAALGDDANFSTTVTNSIATKLPLSGGTMTGDLNINKDNPQIQLYDTGTGGTIWRINNGADGNGKLTFNDNDTERVTFTNSGNVGIGTSSPTSKLDVSGQVNADVIELVGGTTYDPAGGGAGTDTATDVGLAIPSGTRIVGTNDGYIRTLIEWNASGDIQIGQGGTSLIGGINLLPGSSGLVKINGTTIATVDDVDSAVAANSGGGGSGQFFGFF